VRGDGDDGDQQHGAQRRQAGGGEAVGHGAPRPGARSDRGDWVSWEGREREREREKERVRFIFSLQNSQTGHNHLSNIYFTFAGITEPERIVCNLFRLLGCWDFIYCSSFICLDLICL